MVYFLTNWSMGEQ